MTEAGSEGPQKYRDGNISFPESNGGWEMFTNTEISRSKSLEKLVDETIKWYGTTSPGSFDEAAIKDGAAVVHRILRECGQAPELKDAPDKFVLTEENKYRTYIEDKPKIFSEHMDSIHESAFDRFDELSPSGVERELGITLRKILKKHESKPSFTMGAEIAYAAFTDARRRENQLDQQVRKLSSHMDTELDALTGKTPQTEDPFTSIVNAQLTDIDHKL